MSARISVRHSESGCWKVMRGTYVVDIYPAHMLAHAYRSAVQEAIYTNLSIVGMEITT